MAHIGYRSYNRPHSNLWNSQATLTFSFTRGPIFPYLSKKQLSAGLILKFDRATLTHVALKIVCVSRSYWKMEWICDPRVNAHELVILFYTQIIIIELFTNKRKILNGFCYLRKDPSVPSAVVNNFVILKNHKITEIINSLKLHQLSFPLFAVSNYFRVPG